MPTAIWWQQSAKQSQAVRPAVLSGEIDSLRKKVADAKRAEEFLPIEPVRRTNNTTLSAQQPEDHYE